MSSQAHFASSAAALSCGKFRRSGAARGNRQRSPKRKRRMRRGRRTLANLSAKTIKLTLARREQRRELLAKQDASLSSCSVVVGWGGVGVVGDDGTDRRSREGVLAWQCRWHVRISRCWLPHVIRALATHKLPVWKVLTMLPYFLRFCSYIRRWMRRCVRCVLVSQSTKDFLELLECDEPGPRGIHVPTRWC